jgi:hypothetical protein
MLFHMDIGEADDFRLRPRNYCYFKKTKREKDWIRGDAEEEY